MSLTLLDISNVPRLIIEGPSIALSSIDGNPSFSLDLSKECIKVGPKISPFPLAKPPQRHSISSLTK